MNLRRAPRRKVNKWAGQLINWQSPKMELQGREEEEEV
jgi:hypothetical protein